MNKVEPIFDIVGIGDLDAARAVTAVAASTAGLSAEGAHFAHASAARTE